MTPVAAWFGAAVGVSLLLTLACERIAPRIGLVAALRHDRWHREPVPLLGGAAIALTIVALLIAALGGHRDMLVLCAASVAMATVGLVDDRFSLKPQAKLIAQIILASALIQFGFVLRLTPYPLLDVFLSLFWLVGITNAFNLLDNMDGLAAGIAFIAAGFRLFFFVQDGYAPGVLAAAVFMGAVLGFLLRNFPPASIFMGDAGSLFLGFFLAGLSLSGSFPYSRGMAAVLVVPVLLLLVPIFDTTFVTVTRLLSGRRISEGGRDHTSHRLIAIGVSERWVLLFFYGIAAISGGVAVLSYEAGFSSTVLVLVLLGLALLFLGIHLGRIHAVEARVAESRGTIVKLVSDFPYKRHVFTVTLDLVLIIVAYYGAFVLRFEHEAVLYLPWFFRSVPILVMAQLGALALVGLYRGVWRYTGIPDLVNVVKGTTLGSATAVVALLSLYGIDGFSRVVFVIDWLLLLLLVAASRISFRVLGQVLRPAPATGRRVLIYGADDGGEVAVRELLNNPALGRVPVGFIDDDVHKAGTRIHGIAILGGLSRLGELLRRHDISEVIVSSRVPDPGHLRQLSEVCEGRGVPVVRLTIRLDTDTREAM